MKISGVRAIHPDLPGEPRDWRSWFGQILVAVDTEEGLTGYGVGGGGTAGVSVVQTVLRAALLEKDPSDVEGLWTRMFHHILPFGPEGLAMMALSGVDLALWDLRGKSQGKSVAELLGGTSGRRIPAYATVSDLEGVEAALRSGCKAVKINVKNLDPHRSSDRIVDLVERVRDAIGPEGQLMADAFMAWDVPGTLGIADKIAHYNLMWLEEPLPPIDLDGYDRLSRECPIPIAGGEHKFVASAFEELMQRRLHAVLQPDVCWCGGLTQLLNLYKMAGRYGLRICPHRGSEVWALHAIAAVDPSPLAESGRPWMSWIEGQPEIRNGTVRLGDRPGFGVSFDDRLC